MLKEKQKRIALIVEQGFGARVLLQSNVIKTILDSGARVTILSPDPDVLKEYAKNREWTGVSFTKLHTEEYRKHSNKLDVIFQRLRAFGVRVRTVDDLFKMAWKDALYLGRLKPVLMLATVRVVSLLMNWIPALARIITALENRLCAPRVHEEFFANFQPDVIVCTSLGTFDNDRFIMREAKKNNAKVVSYVLSWDNTTVRGLGTNLADSVIVWSDIMKDELIRLHHMSPEKIQIGGVPHYDYYVTEHESIIDRKSLTDLFGFSQKSRLLFLGTKSPNTFLYNPEIAEDICMAIHTGMLPKDCHLIVRLHPIYYRMNNGKYLFENELKEWDRIIEKFGRSLITVDFPDIIEGRINMFMPDSEIAKLESLLRYSEVVINMFSTLNVEASIFDSPTVNVSFQYTHKKPPGNKMERFNIEYDEIQTHNQRIIKSGGTVVARSPEELICAIKQYLQNSGRLHAGRKKIVETECGGYLGTSGKTVGDLVLKAAGK